MRTYVVIAANITLAMALPVAYTDLVMDKLDAWQRKQVEVVVPTLWAYEIAEGIKTAVDKGFLSLGKGFLAIEAIFSLGYKRVHPTVELSKMSLAWSRTLGLAKTDEGQYLALAEMLAAEFWTADEKLVTLAHREGADWVKWIESAGEVSKKGQQESGLVESSVEGAES